MKALRFTVAVADQRTPSGTIYPKAVIERAVANAQGRIQEKRVTVHSGSPPTLDNLIGIVNKLEVQGDRAVAEIQFTGQDQGVQGFAFDGFGYVDEDQRVRDYELTALVSTPRRYDPRIGDLLGVPHTDTCKKRGLMHDGPCPE
jgi:hypothetical protein